MEVDDENNTIGDNEMVLIEGMDYPLDFSIPLMPDFPSAIEAHQASAMPTRGSSLAVYRSEIGSHSRETSADPPPDMIRSSSGNCVPEHTSVFAAQDRWSIFQCNPPSDSGPFLKTARIYLEGLEHALESEDAWQQRDWHSQTIDTLHNEASLQVEPFSSYAREKLVAVTQAILQKALDTHRVGSCNQRSAASIEGRGFTPLPPPTALEYFLKAYVSRCEPYYTCVPAGSVRPNELMRLGNVKASCLFLLLMIAQGAAAIPTMEARYLSSGLTEACRISLHDILEKDSELVQNLMVLQCGLLCTNVATWSGDRWHMEVRFMCDRVNQST